MQFVKYILTTFVNIQNKFVFYHHLRSSRFIPMLPLVSDAGDLLKNVTHLPVVWCDELKFV